MVIGADSSATFAAGQFHTIEQTTDKIDIIHDSIIVAGTGQAGLGQRFCEVVRRQWSNGAAKAGTIEFCKTLAREAITDFQSTAAPKAAYGALVAFPCSTQPHLCEFPPSDFQPEIKNEKMWYVSMGSAQPITDPFLGFIREVFWEGGRPKVQDAIFAVTWALEQAVSLNPGGVNAPIRVAILERVNGHLKSRRLSDEELDQHRQNVAAAKAHLRDFRSKHQPSAAEALPEIPQA